MPTWLEEFLVVLAYSKRAQLAIWLGLISFVVILVLGVVMAHNLELHGILAPLTAVIRETLIARYDKAAWTSLGLFLLLAAKFYRKDKKRLLGQ